MLGPLDQLDQNFQNAVLYINRKNSSIKNGIGDSFDKATVKDFQSLGMIPRSIIDIFEEINFISKNNPHLNYQVFCQSLFLYAE